MSTHRFERVPGRTYSLCTQCGLLMKTKEENEAMPCLPKERPIKEDEPKLIIRATPQFPKVPRARS